MLKKSVFLLLIAPFMAKAQVINGPVVSGRYEQTFLMENFDAPTAAWPVVSNADNLLLIQEGEMIIQRRSTSNPFAVMGTIENSLTDFRLVTSMKLVKAGDDGSLGFLFMGQQGGNGGFIFEVNNKQEYRLRQLTGSVSRFLSGDLRNNGWVRSALVKETGNANIVEIRTANRKYDVFLNNKYLMSFSEMAYRTGNFGYVAGPASKGVIDFLYIFQGENNTPSNAVANKPTEPADEDVIALSESIITLRNQINKLNAENEELRTLIKMQRTEQNDFKTDNEDLKKQITELQSSVSKLRQSNDSLLQVNAELSKLKGLTEGQGENDVIIALSKNLKAEKQRSDQLRNENIQLRQELDKLRGTNGN